MSEKNNLEIRKYKLAIPVIKELASKDQYNSLWKDWLYYSLPLILTIVFGTFFDFIFTLLNIPNPPLIHLQFSQILDIAKTLVAPIVTVNGFCITLVPVISFDYLAQIKEEQKEMIDDLKEEKKKFSDPEDLKVMETVIECCNAFWHNLRAGIMRYVRLFIIVSLLLLISAISSYVVLAYVNPYYFILLDSFVLFFNLFGIAPIIKRALQEPDMKLK